MAATASYDEQAALHEAGEEALMQQEMEYLLSLHVSAECEGMLESEHIFSASPVTPPLEHAEILHMSPVTPPLTQSVDMLTQSAECFPGDHLEASPVTPPLTNADPRHGRQVQEIVPSQGWFVRRGWQEKEEEGCQEAMSRTRNRYMYKWLTPVRKPPLNRIILSRAENFNGVQTIRIQKLK